MGRRKNSGFFETLYKAVFQTGTTVHRSRDLAGRKRTIVKHHDSGKTKTYTHGTGFTGRTTRTETRKGGKVTERGNLKRSLIRGTPIEKSKKTDGSGKSVKRTYGRGVFQNKMKTETYRGSKRISQGETKSGFFGGTTTKHVGECYGCSGNGRKTVGCRTCKGTGTYEGQCSICTGSGKYQAAARECLFCKGGGTYRGATCEKCAGSGQFVPPEYRCRKCKGQGKFSAGCKRCESTGSINISCKRCGGSGVYSRGL